ncbi:MAG: branched-chain amino acid ABC transporter permease [Clostridiales bacterium GWB2_37_7]|nr:MAG: branched-chain amino acid ABC transporter permease [Clostridiales bacterium GWB2_37_7]
MKKSFEFKEGLKAGIPIAVGYLPIAITFGLMTKAAGIPSYVGILMSLVLYAGASQFVGINLLVLGAASWEIVLTTFILNLRHFLMSASLSQSLKPDSSKTFLPLASFGITDETFTVASLNSKDKLDVYYLLGLNIIAYGAWNIGTWFGLFLASGLPQSLKDSMGIALYAMFLGLLIPSAAKSKSVLIIALTAAAIHALIKWLPMFNALSAGWSIIISTIIAAALGAYLYPQEENQDA